MRARGLHLLYLVRGPVTPVAPLATCARRVVCMTQEKLAGWLASHADPGSAIARQQAIVTQLTAWQAKLKKR